MTDFRDKLLPIFLEESASHLRTVARGLKALSEEREDNPALLEESYRCAHSLKGTAALVRHLTASTLAERLEGEIEAILQGSVSPTPLRVKALRFTLGHLNRVVDAVRNGREEPPGALETVEKAWRSVHQGETSPPRTGNLSLDAGLPSLENIFPEPPPETVPESQESPPETPEIKRPEPVCCRFRMGGRLYHLPIEQMTEIAPCPGLTPLPLAPDYLEGLATLRGHVVPVVNLQRLTDPSARQIGSYLVVGETDGELVAFLSEELPNLETERVGEPVDTETFIAEHRVRAI